MARGASRAPLTVSHLVTRPGGKGNVVILSEEEFTGSRETGHPPGSQTNAARLLASIR